MSGRKTGKDKNGSKGTRSKEKQLEVFSTSGDANVVVVVTEEDKESSGDKKDPEQAGEQSCTFCQEADNDEMVQCDKCDRWIHFACVGVTEGIADESWSCPKCVTTTGIQQPSSSAINRLPIIYSSRAGQQKPAATKDQFTSKASLEVGKNIHCHDKTAHSLKSSSSRRSLLQLQLQRLEEEREHEKQQAEKHRAYLDRKYELLEQMHSRTGSEYSGSQERIRQWVQDTNNIRTEDALDPRFAEVFEPQRHSTQNYSGEAQVGSTPPATRFRQSDCRIEEVDGR